MDEIEKLKEKIKDLEKEIEMIELKEEIERLQRKLDQKKCCHKWVYPIQPTWYYKNNYTTTKDCKLDNITVTI